MNYLRKACYGALLVIGLASIAPLPASANGSHWDPSCNCRRPNVEYNTRRTVHEPARVVTRHHVVDETRVVRGRTKIVQENRKIVHVRPVIHRDVIVHRENTVVRDVVLHRVRTSHAYREEHIGEVADVYVPGTVRHVREYRDVAGCECDCRRGLFTSRY